MLYSMTGYGKAETSLRRGTLHLEVRSVNSKSIDLNFQIPNYLRGMESALRKTIAHSLGRGKLDCRVYFENEPSSSGHELNYPLIKKYHSELKKAAKGLGIQSEIEMGQLLRLPDIFVKEGPVTLSGADEMKVHMALKKALKELVRFRKQEGAVLEKDMMKRIGSILRTVKLIEPYDKKRLLKIRARFTKQFKQVSKEGALDKNRFEQELIYYIEKLDLTEEKVRLQAHCNYFKKTARSQDGAGKKLGFIAQEIGREINTIGSKANDANIQRLIVGAKDELEKIKEQLFNVL
jgi:uncharacterized protein (TIGR00255 family)